MKPNIQVKLLNHTLKNPLIAASGCFGFGREYNNFYDVGILGGICTKGLTYERREGNDSPRVAETASGMLNSVGLQNVGVPEFIKTELPNMLSYGTKIIANVSGFSHLEYCKSVWELSQTEVDFIELNISCPNVKAGGQAFGIQPNSVLEVVREVKNHCLKPLIVKLSPNVAKISDNALAAQDGGADAISLINTVGGMAVDYKTRKPILANVYGGLSGACVKPIALKMIHECYKVVKIPIIGLGGISTAEDILEFMLCGATAVQVGTANFSNPNIMETMINNLTNLLKECKIDDISSIIGQLQG